MRKPRLSLAAMLMVAALSAQAQQAPPPATEPAITDLAPMTVSGVQPGPGLWKVSRDGHVLWILGTLTPLPERMEWRSKEVEDTVAASQELLLAPGMSLDTGRGLFGNLFLLPSLFKAAKNPDGQTLQEVVPAPEYARWSVLKARYLGRDRSVEERRPVFAALELYKAAMKASALSTDNVVAGKVQAVAKRAGLAVTKATVTAKLDDPKAAIREFQRTGLDDRSCFSRTLDVLEHEIDAMRAQANAWAIGDIEQLRNAPQATQYGVCQSAISESGLARKLGISGLRQQSLEKWLDNAQAALAAHPSTFALLPMGLILGRDNLIDALRARGYTVEAPGEY